MTKALLSLPVNLLFVILVFTVRNHRTYCGAGGLDGGAGDGNRGPGSGAGYGNHGAPGAQKQVVAKQ